MRCRAPILALTLGSCLAAGCTNGPQYGQVQGVVTLDNQPLEGANVTFTPDFPEGNPSFGKTNAAGRFTLGESADVSGAVVGPYTVRISTFDAGKPDAEPPLPFVQERVPSKYNIKSTLTCDVKPGENEIDFDLDSDGEIIQIDIDEGIY